MEVGLVRKFGLADALGIVGSLVAIAWLPGSADPLTYVKLLILAAGGLAVAPAVYVRWKGLGRPSWVCLVPMAAAGLIVAWGPIASVGSGAPMWNTVFGWWGRGDGWLAWLGAAVLLLGAANLSAREVARTVTWLLGGASVVALIGFLQVGGADIPQGAGSTVVTGTMGNSNFAAGYFAIMGILALGRALTQAALWQRIWAGALFLAISFLAVRTDAVQGPAALAAGVVAFGIAYALSYRGRFRVAGLAASGAVVVVGGVLLVMSFFAVGPLARLWAERTFDIRQEYWQSAINIMNGLPVFGTGPDGFSRYVAEFRPESYVELLGPTLRVSAAHNIALQFGAVLGWAGLILWIVLFVGTGIALLVRIVRAPVASIGLTASVAGAFTAYFIQGMVSIDMLPLLATGWLVAGLALALAREPLPEVVEEPVEVPKTRKAKAVAVSRTPKKLDGPSTPVWVPVTGGVLALGAVILVGSQIGLTNQVQSISSQEQALDFIANPMTPCVLRVQVTQQVIQQLPAEVSVPATLEATDLDRRCPPMINFASDVLVQQQRFDEAAAYTAEGVEFDPLLDLAWVLRSRYYLGTGDIPAAEAAAEEARRVQVLYPEGASDPALVETLLNDIALAKEQG
jgi:O-antigen ligase